MALSSLLDPSPSFTPDRGESRSIMLPEGCSVRPELVSAGEKQGLSAKGHSAVSFPPLSVLSIGTNFPRDLPIVYLLSQATLHPRISPEMFAEDQVTRISS